LIELLYHAEHAVELLNDKEITSKETRIPVQLRRARGVAHVEAPRGTLIHDYETDENVISFGRTSGCFTELLREARGGVPPLYLLLYCELYNRLHQ